MNLQDKISFKKYVPFVLLGCLIIGFSFLMPEKVFAQSASDGPSPTVTGITAGRAKSLAGGAIALVSVIMGALAKARSKSANRSGAGNNGNKRTQAIISLSLAGIAIILSMIHLSTSAGAVFGSGSGKAGAIVTLVLALIGAALSGLVLRPKRA
ncbi:MAG: DUF6223 family protein [Taibaiella sp.]|jgi:hypothetical protein